MTGRPAALCAMTFALVLGIAGSALGQVSALRKHDTDAPIDIDAQRIEVRDKEKLVLFQGDVKVRQGGLALDAQRIRMKYARSDKASPTVLRIDAEGAVQLRSASEQATAQWGIYDVEAEQVTMGGDVTLARGAEFVRGTRLELNLETGVYTMDGSPALAGSSGSRVTGRFNPPARKGS